MIIIFLLFILVQQDVNGTRIECAPFHSEVGLGTFLINTLASSCFWRFPKKKQQNTCGFVREFLLSCKWHYGPGQSAKKHGKNFLVGRYRFFMSDVISGGLLGHLGPLYLALGANR